MEEVFCNKDLMGMIFDHLELVDVVNFIKCSERFRDVGSLVKSFIYYDSMCYYIKDKKGILSVKLPRSKNVINEKDFYFIDIFRQYRISIVTMYSDRCNKPNCDRVCYFTSCNCRCHHSPCVDESCYKNDFIIKISDEL